MSGDAGTSSDPSQSDADVPQPDASGYLTCDGAIMPADRFVTRVVAFQPGDCAGFGATSMPRIVEGPPIGAGDGQEGLHVVSLGNAGMIVVSFEPNAIVDGPGPDFIVFENPFFAGGDPHRPTAEPGEVSVSDDGVVWAVFPCTATAYPYGACAGWHPVYASPSSCISPFDSSRAGGDAFDLADLGLTHARYVRIVDKTNEPCDTDPRKKLTTNGFDLDAVAIVNGATP